MSTALWPAVASAAALAVGYVGGHLAAAAIRRSLGRLAARTSTDWDDAIVAELVRRTPRWGLLAGIDVAARCWPLPPAIDTAVHRGVFVIAALSVTFAIAAVAVRLVRGYARTAPQALPATGLTETIIRIAIVAVGGLMILDTLGLSITPVLTALGVGGLAVALALQDTLANLFAGVYVTLSRQMQVGDYVKLDSGVEGYLSDISWRSSRITMLPNNVVVVPNAKLAQAIVTNYNLPDREMAVLVEVGVDYASDLEHVERVTCEVAADVLRTTAGGVATFEPFIRFHTFADSSVNFTVILRASQFVDQYLIKHEFVKRLHARYRAEGITIPFPIRTIIAAGGASTP